MSDKNLLAVLYTRLAIAGCEPGRLEQLARWYEDHGQPAAAACVRWVRDGGLRPFNYTRQAPLAQHSEVWHHGWYWWATREPGPQGEWGHPRDCRLPHELWLHLRHSFPYPPQVFKEYATLQTAFEALFEAWAAWSAPREGQPRVVHPSTLSHW